MGSKLEVPFQFARVDVKGHDRAGVKVVARPNFRVPVRGGVADPPIEKVELGIKRTC